MQGSASFLHHGCETHVQGSEIQFSSLCSQRGIQEHSQSTTHTGYKMQPSLSIPAPVEESRVMQWQGEARHRGSGQVLKAKSSQTADFAEVRKCCACQVLADTTNQVKLSFNPSEPKPRTDSCSPLSLRWIYMGKQLFKPSLASSALQISALLLSLLYLNFVGFLKLKMPQSRFLGRAQC